MVLVLASLGSGCGFGPTPQYTNYGAIFGESDFRATDPDLAAVAKATVALVEDQFSIADYDQYPRNETVFTAKCGTCGPNLSEVLTTIGGYPNGGDAVVATGVLVRPGVVATVKHVASDLVGKPNAGVLLGFDASPGEWKPRVYGIERICQMEDSARTAGLGDYALIEIADAKGLARDLAAFGVDDSIDALGMDDLEGEPRVVAFGHPWWSARVMTGDNDETYMQYCGQEERWRTTLDSLAGSSGSPVYVLADDGAPRLFGLFRDAEFNGVKCVDGSCDVGRVSPDKGPCEGYGPSVLPLGVIAEEIDAFAAHAELPPEWKCHPVLAGARRKK